MRLVGRATDAVTEATMRAIPISLGVVSTGLLCAGLLGGVRADAQATPPTTLTVVKEVSGDFPSNTVFTVDVVCSGQETVQISFDSEGDPTVNGSNVVIVADKDASCTVDETGDGGATMVGYACTDNAGSFPRGTNGDLCLGLGSSGYVVDFDSGSGDGEEATVTITNTGDLPPAGSNPWPLAGSGVTAVILGLILVMLARRNRHAPTR